MKKLGVLVAVLAVLSIPLITLAQSTNATLMGRVLDPGKATVPGASVEATNVDTNVSYKGTTDSEGRFTIPDLPPGNYRISVAKPGFKSLVKPDVFLHVQDVIALNFDLPLGSVSQVVTVEGGAPLLNTESAAVGTVVDRQFVENIPLNGRSLQPLITLTPGVVLVPSPGTGGSNHGQFSVNGQRANSNYFTVDGLSANVGNIGNSTGQAGQAASGTLPALTAGGGTNGLVSIDALQEFRIQTSTYSAEFGRGPGGQIAFVTRSGTNDLHGSAFDYVRNEAFDSSDWFVNRALQPRPPERQHDFGGTLGGPVFLPWFGKGHSLYNGRNKTFFFFSYEGLRLRLPKFALTNVPTTGLRQAAPAGVAPLLNSFPLPNGRDLGNGMAEFATTYSDPSTINATSVRIDQVIGSRWTLFGRVNKATSTATTHATTNLAQLSPSSQDLLTISIGVAYAASPHLSNALKANYTNNVGSTVVTLSDFGGAVPVPRSFLIPGQFDSPTAAGGARFFFPGALFSTVQVGGTRSLQRQVQVVDSITYSVGSHQLKAGIDYRRLMPVLGFVSWQLIADFPSQAVVMNGQASGCCIFAAPSSIKPIYTNFSAYGEDTWKAFRRLTLTLGLRWELNPPPGEANGNGPVAVRGLDNLATADIAPRGTPLWGTTYDNFAPRVGVAYLLSQKPSRETVIRGGFGVFYDAGNDQASKPFIDFPFQSSRNVSSVSFPLNPVQVVPPALPSLTPPYNGTVDAFDPHLKLPYTLQWNVGLERSLGRSQAVSASYVGAVGRRLIRQIGLNSTFLTTANPRFTALRIIDNAATSDYHSLQVQFQRRLASGLQVLSSYTWAHAIDEASSDISGDGDNVLRRGNSDFDIRHNFATAVTYDFPAPQTANFAHVLLGGWAIDSRVNAQSAFPLNVTSGTIVDPLDGTVRSNRANLNAGVPLYVSSPSSPGGRLINRAAFSIPAAGQLGTLGRNIVRGLASWQVDSALRRQFKLTDKASLQFRAEAFNLFNHPNFGAINTDLTSASFGAATNMLGRQLGGQNALYQVGGPRSLQFALKLQF